MIRMIAVAAAALALIASPAAAQKLDKSGKCHDAKGRFVAMSFCKGAAPAAPLKCRDKTTKKFAKCSAPNTEPVPATATKK